ncbi:MAG: class I SAM-dependent methyltransferase [Candidatus Electrothrix sp. ATG2]|nr:class I SAM-dependent methyltransferase [Candidatus Electrothrix sp. ATG2]
MKVFLSDRRTIAFFQQKATPDFWDAHWETGNLKAQISSCRSDSYFVPAVQQTLPLNSLVLEGGCGKGLIVHALNYQGYQAIGLDFAASTVSRVKKAVPNLNMITGDVFSLPLRDQSIDGYISGGVIEHFSDGCLPILQEMSRVIRENGYLYISFPYMSPLRRVKGFMRMYPVRDSDYLERRKNEFYQFALRHDVVIGELEKLGFSLQEISAFDGIKGFKDEVAWARPFLQKVYDGKVLTGKFTRHIRGYLDSVFKLFAAHCIFLVFQKKTV